MTRHKHHDLIVAWAADTSQVLQWRHPEDETGIWSPLTSSTPSWASHLEWRFKPTTIMIGDVEITAPERVAPAEGVRFHLPNILNTYKEIDVEWFGDSNDMRRLNDGLVFLTEADAIACAKALLKLLEVKP